MLNDTHDIRALMQQARELLTMSESYGANRKRDACYAAAAVLVEAAMADLLKRVPEETAHG